jgi:hypothetical protein
MTRAGLRIRGHRGHPEVRQALVRYAAWLRKSQEFPIRVPVYLFPSEWILTQDGHRATASFFAPFDRRVEPFVRIATGDYPRLKKERGRDSALAAFILSMSHEIIHYIQWLEGRALNERGVMRRTRSMLRQYASEVDRP